MTTASLPSPNRLVASTLFVALLSCGACSPDNVLATVAGENITKEDLAAHRKAFPGQTPSVALGALVDDARTRGEAKRRGLSDDATVRAKTRAASAGVLRQTLRATLTLSPTQLSAYYDTHKDDFAQQSLDAAQIAFFRRPTEAGGDIATDADTRRRALGAYAELKAGQPFADVAMRRSEDRASALKGGRLGTLTKGRVDARLYDLVNSLRPGDFSEPTATPFGYVLVKKLTDETTSTPSFAQIKNQVEAAAFAAAHATYSQELAQRFPETRHKGAPPKSPLASPARKNGSPNSVSSQERESNLPGREQ